MSIKNTSYFEKFQTHRVHYREPGDFVRFEVFHRYIFTSISPLGREASGKLSHDLTLPAGTVSHVTHRPGQLAITKDFEDAYTFKPSAKWGYAVGSCAEAYVDTFLTPGMKEFRTSLGIKQQYKFVGPDNLILKGFFSWWGIDVSELLENASPEIKAILDAAKPPPSYTDPPVSIFGPIAFSMSLEYLFLSYQNSRHTKTDEPKPDIYLLVGGTLRYPQQFNCVIIVCTEHDLQSEALKDYRPLQIAAVDNGIDPVFLPNGLINENGKIVDFSSASKAKFRPRFMSEYIAWSFLVFALYYNCEEDRLKVSRDHVAMLSAQGHTDDICLLKRKVSTETGDKWMCPDNL